ncbi:probable serine/threonine-protein kinase clkA [Achroia grisella]|uniref:probable serine/threonine-protein kinase clkA n=1 Tax=Achroia grisella TaxID=688607 RepID=UPI0027D23EDD|nr:probable serine/threonine-protein kinase clkA [Achroia grisella]
MGTDLILTRMAKYDFTAPIDVEFFEEMDDKNSIEIKNTDPNKNNDCDDDVIYVCELPTNSTENNKKNSNEVLSNNTENNNVYDNINTKKKDNCEKDIHLKQILLNQATMIPTIQNQNHVHMNHRLSGTMKSTELDKTKDPLNTVSECLINIMNAYIRHVHIRYNQQNTASTIEESKKHYLHIKYKLFKICHDIVLSKIVPEENNKTFIEKFLNNTISFLSDKINRIKICYIRTIFREMLFWAKNNKAPTVAYGKNYPFTLLQQLTSPPKAVSFGGSNTIHSPQINTNSASSPSCLFTFGPPGREIRINTLKEIYSNNGREHISSNHVPTVNGTNTDYQTQSTTNTLYNNQTPNGIQSSENMVTSNFQLENHNNITNMYNQGPPPNYYTAMYQKNSALNNSAICNQRLSYPNVSTIIENKVPNETCIIQYKDKSNETSQNSPNRHLRQTNSFTSHHPAKRARHSSLYNDSRPINTDHDLENNSRLRNVQTAPPRYEINLQNQIQTQNNNGTQNKHHFNVSSNESVMFNNEMGTTYCTVDILNTLLELEDQTENLHFDTGRCCVCNKITKTMCSACYNRYYCSLECQRSDWRFHKTNCLK